MYRNITHYFISVLGKVIITKIAAVQIFQNIYTLKYIKGDNHINKIPNYVILDLSNSLCSTCIWCVGISVLPV